MSSIVNRGWIKSRFEEYSYPSYPRPNLPPPSMIGWSAQLAIADYVCLRAIYTSRQSCTNWRILSKFARFCCVGPRSTGEEERWGLFRRLIPVGRQKRSPISRIVRTWSRMSSQTFPSIRQELCLQYSFLRGRIFEQALWSFVHPICRPIPIIAVKKGSRVLALFGPVVNGSFHNDADVSYDPERLRRCAAADQLAPSANASPTKCSVDLYFQTQNYPSMQSFRCLRRAASAKRKRIDCPWIAHTLKRIGNDEFLKIGFPLRNLPVKRINTDDPQPSGMKNNMKPNFRIPG